MDLPGVCVDIEAVARFTDAHERLFTAGEWEHAKGKPDSLAGIWCVKEAVVKATSRWRALHVRDVEVQWDGDRPFVDVPGFQIAVSISHTSDHAVGMAYALPRTQTEGTLPNDGG